MATNMFEYTKIILKKVSFNPVLFCKELQKALKLLLPYEIEKLKIWVQKFTQQKPQLKQCLIYI